MPQSEGRDLIGEMLDKIDLVALVGEDVGLKGNGKEWHGPCPFECAGEDRFVVTGGWWYCRGCCEGGTAVKYMMKKHGVGAMVAVEMLQKMTGDEFDAKAALASAELAKRERSAHVERVPSQEFRDVAKKAAIDCEYALWNTVGGLSSLRYLRSRGLEDKTILRFRLGHSDGSVRHGLKMPMGVVIPKAYKKEVWMLKVRRLDDRKPKYVNASFAVDGGLVGGVNVAFGLWDGKNDLILTEGEFDAMLLWQKAGDVVGVLTMGGASESPDRSGNMAIAAARGRVFLAYDGDEAGQDATVRLMGAFPRMERAFLPEGKDVTDYWAAGGDLKAWVDGLLKEKHEEHPLTSECREWLRWSGWVRVFSKRRREFYYLCSKAWFGCFRALGGRCWETALNDRAVSQLLGVIGAEDVAMERCPVVLRDVVDETLKLFEGSVVVC